MQASAEEKADPKGEQLAAMIAEIRKRIRAQHPTGAVVGDVALPDLLPLLHARDAAEAKVAAIGTVNPRPPGLLNSTAQFIKRLVARALDWHVREQVEFNRAVMSCVQATLETLGESNRAMSAIAGRLQELHDIAREIRDTRSHWVEWRAAWEQKLTENEIHFLRGVSELQAAFQHRVTLLEENFRDLLKLQHGDFEGALRRSGDDIQKRLWDDLARIRAEYDGMIHAELRILRQRAALKELVSGPEAKPIAGERGSAPLSEPRPPGEPGRPGGLDRLDWLKFADRFRGGEQFTKERQRLYGERFHDSPDVLDIGCGRGELLEVLKGAGVAARGIDLSEEAVALCRSKGLEAERADLFEYLRSQPDQSLGGIVCSQVVEHLAPERIPELIRLAHEKMRREGLIGIETPNPECLAIFATHFYLDPTHTRPVPPPLLAFYLEEAGFGGIAIERLYPAVETMPSLASLPEDFRKEFFGSLDYAIFARRLP